MKAICIKNYHYCNPTQYPEYKNRFQYWLKKFKIYDYWVDNEAPYKIKYFIIDETILNEISSTPVRMGKKTFYKHMMPIEENK